MSHNKALSQRRKQKDIFKLRSSSYDVQQTDHHSTFLVTFHGPKQTPYQKGKWKVNLYLPQQYPYKSPSVGFLNRIFHPNIDYTSGSVCLDVINQTWTPMYQLVNIFQIFLPQLLTYPNPASPLNHEAAELFEKDVEKYNKKVKECVQKHAVDKEESRQNQAAGEVESIESGSCSLSDRNSEFQDYEMQLQNF